MNRRRGGIFINMELIMRCERKRIPLLKRYEFSCLQTVKDL